MAAVKSSYRRRMVRSTSITVRIVLPANGAVMTVVISAGINVVVYLKNFSKTKRVKVNIGIKRLANALASN